MYRTRKHNKKYDPRGTHQEVRTGSRDCPFCKFPSKQIVQEGNTMLVVKNIFPYQFWEFMKVTHHFMVVPMRHLESISDLTRAEKSELIDILADYQGRGYNMYGREQGNIIKSIPHQHTHLIKCDSKNAKFYLFMRKPYLLIRR